MALWVLGSGAWGVCLGLIVSGIRKARFDRKELPFWLAAAAMLALSLRLVLDPERGFTFVVDDAYYYLQIARNLDATGMVTFDGLHETNGFHPLWLGMLATLHRLLPEVSDLAFVTAVQSAALLLAAAGLAWLQRLLAPVAGPLARTVGALVLFNPWALSRFWLSGMESSLALLLLIAFLCHWRELLESPDFDLLLRSGLLGGLVCLARLDLVLVVVPAVVLTGWLWLREETGFGAMPRGAMTAWHLLAGGAAFAIPVAAWLVWNRVRFGSFGTVSSYVKTALWPMSLAERYDNLCLVLPSLKFLFPVPVLRIASPVLLIAAALAAWRLIRTVPRGPARITFSLLAWTAGVHYVLARGGVAESYSWYYLLETLLAVKVAAAAVGLVEPGSGRSAGLPETLARGASASGAAAAGAAGRRRLAAVVVGLAVLVSLWLVTDLLRDEPGWFVSRAIQKEGKAAAEWIGRETAEDAVVAAWDAGILGYFAHRPVINLDGLVNDWEFVEVMRARTFRDYLVRNGVDYVANSFFVLEDGSLWHQREGMDEVTPWLRPMYRGREVPFLGVPVTVGVFRFEPGGGP